MSFSPGVGDRVTVAVTRGTGESLTVLRRVPGRVVHVGFKSTFGPGAPVPQYSVVLEADAGPGWEAGDTYRTTKDWLKPLEAAKAVTQ